MAPNHFRIAEDLVAVATKPHITWVRGDPDAIVSDTSLFDLSYLGSLGFVPGWPGADGEPAAADGRPDPGGARPVRGGGRQLPRGGLRRLRPLARTSSGRPSSSPSCSSCDRMTYRMRGVPVDGGDLTVGVWGDERPAGGRRARDHLAPPGLGLCRPRPRPPTTGSSPPDLRGRGRSRDLPGPYGMERHAGRPGRGDQGVRRAGRGRRPLDGRVGGDRAGPRRTRCWSTAWCWSTAARRWRRRRVCRPTPTPEQVTPR